MKKQKAPFALDCKGQQEKPPLWRGTAYNVPRQKYNTIIIKETRHFVKLSRAARAAVKGLYGVVK